MRRHVRVRDTSIEVYTREPDPAGGRAAEERVLMFLEWDEVMELVKDLKAALPKLSVAKMTAARGKLMSAKKDLEEQKRRVRSAAAIVRRLEKEAKGG